MTSTHPPMTTQDLPDQPVPAPAGRPANLPARPNTRLLFVVFSALILSLAALFLLWAATGFKATAYSVQERLFGASVVAVIFVVCFFPWDVLRAHAQQRANRGRSPAPPDQPAAPPRQTPDLAQYKESNTAFTAMNLLRNHRPYVIVLISVYLGALFNFTLGPSALKLTLPAGIEFAFAYALMITAGFFIRGLLLTLRDAIELHHPHWSTRAADRITAALPANAVLAALLFVLTILWIVIFPVILLSESPILTLRAAPAPTQSAIRLRIQAIRFDPPAITANIEFNNLSDPQRAALQQAGAVTLNHQPVALRFDDPANIVGQQPVALAVLSGTSFQFPFSVFKTSVPLNGLAAAGLDDAIPIVAVNQITDLRIGNPQQTDAGLTFDVRFSHIYPSLFIGIMLAMLGFLWAIWKARQPDHLIELAIGVFAALIAIRSFLLPGNINTPTVVDIIVLIYILLLIIVFLIRYFELTRPPAGANTPQGDTHVN